MTPTSVSIMITLEQCLIVALECQNYMYVVDVYYSMLKTMLKNCSFTLLAIKAAMTEDV